MLPILRLPIPPNPAPEPLRPEAIRDVFTGVTTGMEAARAALEPIGDGSDLAVEIALGDIWFDVNANGTRDEAEDIGSVAGPILLGWEWDARDPSQPLPTIRFDGADAAWLSAYAHLLSGLSEAVLAHDPTAAIAENLQTRAALADLNGTAPGDEMQDMFGDALDAIQW